MRFCTLGIGSSIRIEVPAPEKKGLLFRLIRKGAAGRKYSLALEEGVSDCGLACGPGIHQIRYRGLHCPQSGGGTEWTHDRMLKDFRLTLNFIQLFCPEKTEMKRTCHQDVESKYLFSQCSNKCIKFYLNAIMPGILLCSLEYVYI